MINSPVELLAQAKRIIDASPETRLDWAHASTEDRTLMLIVAAWRIGFDNGYDTGQANIRDGID